MIKLKSFLAAILLTACGAWAQSGLAGSFSWSISGGTLNINTMGLEFVTPQILDFQSPWFQHRDSFTKVVIRDGSLSNARMSSIGIEAFNGCGITEIVFPSPSYILRIGRSAFAHNNLTELVIPNSVTTIGNSAFLNNHLTNLVIPNSITTIEPGAFANNSLTELVIPNSVTTIGNSAFANGNLLSEAAFQNNRLTEVVIPNSVTTIGSDAFARNNLTKAIIGNSVTTIGREAFRYNNLTEIIIPSSVANIGDFAFWDNDIRHIVYLSPESRGAFFGSRYLNDRGLIISHFRYPIAIGFRSSNIIVDNKLVGLRESREMPEVAYTGKPITIDIDDYMVRYPIVVKGYQVGNLIIEDSWTFRNWNLVEGRDYTAEYFDNTGPGLAKIKITGKGEHSYLNESVFFLINENPHGEAGSLTWRVDGETLTIGGVGDMPHHMHALRPWHAYRRSITKVVIDGEITSVGNGAFGSYGLTEVIIGNSVTTIEFTAFAENNLTEIVIGSSVTIIQDGAFANSGNITRVTNLAENPQSISSGQLTRVFEATSLANATLYVPSASLAAYKAANVWKDFKEILPIDDENTSIRNHQTNNDRHGILLENAIVSDVAKISVITPEPATINLRILDNLGNVVFAADGVGAGFARPENRTNGDLGGQTPPLQNAIVWNLQNQSGRFVANGTYLVIVEATGISGRRFTYSARIGINR